MNVNGLNLAVIDEGPRDGTPVVLLHGFPDRGSMWHNQIAALTDAGYRVVAPDLRGFGDSDAPEGVENYSLLNLLGDITGILDQLGIAQAHVVGHDWGAALAWLMATFAADRVLSLTAVSVGHPSAFSNAGWEQKQKSWYMLAFQHVGLAEDMVMHDNFKFFEQWGEGGSTKQWEADLTRPGRMTSTLNIYRANVPAESLLATGLFTGVTTNPTILQRASKGVADLGDIYRWAIAAGAREVFFQAWGTEAATLIERGQWLRDLGQEVVVKFVATREGATACAALAREGVPTLLTAIYDPGQVIVAAAAGATYIAPYLGRLNDAGRQGIAEVIAMHEVLVATGSSTKVLLASIRSVPDMVALARHGVDCFTMAPAVAEQFFTDPTTAEAARTFEDAVRETSA